MTNNMEEQNKDQIEELNENLEILTQEIEETNSRKNSFIKGLFVGVGTTLGATIIAAIIITILVWVFKTFENVPLIGDILRWLNIEQYIHGR
jgi:cell division septal protein FtsQ